MATKLTDDYVAQLVMGEVGTILVELKDLHAKVDKSTDVVTTSTRRMREACADERVAMRGETVAQAAILLKQLESVMATVKPAQYAWQGSKPTESDIVTLNRIALERVKAHLKITAIFSGVSVLLFAAGVGIGSGDFRASITAFVAVIIGGSLGVAGVKLYEKTSLE